MADRKLFLAGDGSWVTSSTILAALDRVGAAACRILYLHTGMTFGLPNPELPRRELLNHLWELIADLGVPSVLLPTFTFSYCNGEDYDVQRSRSRMGALNEHLRALPEAVRSLDPLMSNILLGEDLDLVTSLGRQSVGEGSTFHRLHLRGGQVRFLFLGTTASECFTYTHYVEERQDVPYRYRRPFRGRITNQGATWEDEYHLFVRFHGVVPATDGKLERTLYQRGLLHRVPCGDSSISCVGEADAYGVIREQLQTDVRCYIAEDPGDRDRTFEARRMVAL